MLLALHCVKCESYYFRIPRNIKTSGIAGSNECIRMYDTRLHVYTRNQPMQCYAICACMCWVSRAWVRWNQFTLVASMRSLIVLAWKYESSLFDVILQNCQRTLTLRQPMHIGSLMIFFIFFFFLEFFPHHPWYIFTFPCWILFPCKLRYSNGRNKFMFCAWKGIKLVFLLRFTLWWIPICWTCDESKSMTYCILLIMRLHFFISLHAIWNNIIAWHSINEINWINS